MKLEGKKELAARTLGVGKERIVFNTARLAEVKEAITKQDIRDLVQAKAIFVKEIKGRAKVERRSTRRRAGSIRKKVKPKKLGYMILTRKLRSIIADLRVKEKISEELYQKLRKEIKAHSFRDKHQMKERITLLQK